MSSNTASPSSSDLWLRDEDPDLFYLLRALDGEQEAYLWLETSSPTIHLFTQAIGGSRQALERFAQQQGVDASDLAGLIGLSNGVVQWLAERHPEVYSLFEAIKGDDAALRQLKRRRTALARLAEAARPVYAQGQTGDLPLSSPGEQGNTLLDEDEAADVGCLVGEMHLRQGEYHRAIEAFTRSLEGTPTADAHEGRARAYRALAELDDQLAQQLRQA